MGTSRFGLLPLATPTALPPVAHSTSDTASDTGPPKSATANKQDPNWIWSPASAEHLNQKTPGGTCYFRRSFEMTQPEAGEVQITADASYELYVNGRKAGEGKNWHVMDVVDVTKYLAAGKNTIAILATKNEPGACGMAARVLVKNAGDTLCRLPDERQLENEPEGICRLDRRKCSTRSQWLAAREIGQAGVVKPWLDEGAKFGRRGGLDNRFKISSEFHGDRASGRIPAEDRGKLADLELAFNEFGELVPPAREGSARSSYYASATPGGLPNRVSCLLRRY